MNEKSQDNEKSHDKSHDKVRWFSCRTCSARAKTTDGVYPPGWVIIRRYPGTLDHRPELLGILCDNIYCLSHHVDALVDDYERLHPQHPSEGVEVHENGALAQ